MAIKIGDYSKSVIIFLGKGAGRSKKLKSRIKRGKWNQIREEIIKEVRKE